MSKLFGSKENFGVEIEYDEDAIEADLITSDVYMGGQIKFWVNSKNLFEYDFSGEDATYWNDLNDIVEYFCTNLRYHVIDEPFPFTVNSKYPCDIVEEVYPVAGLSIEEQIFSALERNISAEIDNSMRQWFEKHGFFSYTTFSFLPNMFFQKSGKLVEISWNNHSPFRAEWGDFWGVYRKGVEYVDIATYKKVILEFCRDFLERFRERKPEIINEYEDKLRESGFL